MICPLSGSAASQNPQLLWRKKSGYVFQNMIKIIKIERQCPEGHRYFKSSDCPVCPVCEASASEGELFSGLSAPARRALEHHGISSLKALASCRESELLALHGFGPASLPKLRQLLERKGLAFKK
jgi:predicted RecB family nuclease